MEEKTKKDKIQFLELLRIAENPSSDTYEVQYVIDDTKIMIFVNVFAYYFCCFIVDA
jgi:hypothetical protein